MAKMIFDSERAVEGVFCSKCDCWIDDIYGEPDKCPNCGETFDGWVSAFDKKGE